MAMTRHVITYFCQDPYFVFTLHDKLKCGETNDNYTYTVTVENCETQGRTLSYKITIKLTVYTALPLEWYKRVFFGRVVAGWETEGVADTQLQNLYRQQSSISSILNYG
jgi:hypothetical protein